MLPIAITGGILFYKPISAVQWAVPYLIFTMLLITFCRVRPSEFRIGRSTWLLLAIQIPVAVAVFYLLRPFGLAFAQSAMICILCPTATAAPVVTGMLGGSISKVASYSIVCNLAIAVFAPAFFVFANPEGHIGFVDGFMTIAAKLAPLIVLPLGTAFALYFVAPKVHKAVASIQSISFYLWTVSLFLVVGNAVGFILTEPAGAIPEMIAMALTAALVCLLQFAVGRRIGARYGDKISGAQSLGQKNTVLGIWMATSYLNPLSSIGPAAYIIWQNLINSLQMYYKLRRDADSDSAKGKDEHLQNHEC